MSRAGAGSFELLCEIQPPATADLSTIAEQVRALEGVCDGFLVPDSHLGRATVSSLSIAHEITEMRRRAVACLNARDRNLVGLQRDLLTAAAYGIHELLFVYGDAPHEGERTTLTVRQMLQEVRRNEHARGTDVGVTGDLTRDLPAWKRGADFVCLQPGFDPMAAVRWRERVEFGGRVYAGVIVLASEAMARRLGDLIPGFDPPERLLRSLSRDRRAGLDLAVEQVLALRDAAGIDGAHVIPARKFRETAEALAEAGVSPSAVGDVAPAALRPARPAR